jgi:hypothetical protein
MKQIIKKDKIIITGKPKEVSNQLKLLCLKYNTLKDLLEAYNN